MRRRSRHRLPTHSSHTRTSKLPPCCPRRSEQAQWPGRCRPGHRWHPTSGLMGPKVAREAREIRCCHLGGDQTDMRVCCQAGYEPAQAPVGLARQTSNRRLARGSIECATTRCTPPPTAALAFLRGGTTRCTARLHSPGRSRSAQRGAKYHSRNPEASLSSPW